MFFVGRESPRAVEKRLIVACSVVAGHIGDVASIHLRRVCSCPSAMPPTTPALGRTVIASLAAVDGNGRPVESETHRIPLAFISARACVNWGYVHR